jgi:hypothetical protein
MKTLNDLDIETNKLSIIKNRSYGYSYVRGFDLITEKIKRVADDNIMFVIYEFHVNIRDVLYLTQKFLYGEE